MSDSDLTPQIRAAKSAVKMVDNAAMKTVKCPACGGKTKHNGKTKAGAQRWRCTSCGASTMQRYDNKASMLALFLDWLLSKWTQAQMGMPARTFRSLNSELWSLWPTAPVRDEIHHVKSTPIPLTPFTPPSWTGIVLWTFGIEPMSALPLIFHGR